MLYTHEGIIHSDDALGMALIEKRLIKAEPIHRDSYPWQLNQNGNTIFLRND